MRRELEQSIEKRWDERGKDHTSVDILADLNKKFAGIADARVIAVAPPAIPGISAAGGFSLMLQDLVHDAVSLGEVAIKGYDRPMAVWRLGVERLPAGWRRRC